ncbi:hypothetical protein HC823_00995 [Candidatus Gracilibacteria bacterium]|nr:hypothetical protein [Candidatus Gracilibacteria bacterium]
METEKLLRISSRELPEETPLNFEYDAVNTRWQVSNDNQAGYVSVSADGSGNNYMVPAIANWAEGQVTFEIRILDLAGNELAPPITQTSTTAFDNSTVIYDQTRPLLPNPANVVDLNGRATTRLKVRADATISWTGAVDPDTGLNDLTNISGHDSTATTTHDGNTAGIWKYKMMQTNNFDADDPDSITKGIAPYPYVVDYDQNHSHYDEILAAHGGVYGFSRNPYGPTNANDEPYREIHSGTDSEGRALECLNVGSTSCTCDSLQTHPAEDFHIYPQDINPNATSGTYPATYTRQDVITGFSYLTQVGIGGLGAGAVIDYANGAYSDANLAFNRQRRGAIVTDVTNTGAGSFDGRYTQLDPWVTYGPGLIPPRENDLFNDRYFPYRFHMVVADKAGNHSCGYRVVDDPATNPGGQFVEIDNTYCSSEDSTLGEGLGLDWRGMPIYEQPYTVGISGIVQNNIGEPVIGAMACAVSRDNRDDGPPPANIREFCDAPYETCCDVVDSTGHYGIPVNRDQYYNVTFYKPGFYLQKKDDNLIANQCGIYNDLVLNSILNIFDTVHEWGHIANQPVRVGSSQLFSVGDQLVETAIDVWSLTGNIQVEQADMSRIVPRFEVWDESSECRRIIQTLRSQTSTERMISNRRCILGPETLIQKEITETPSECVDWGRFISQDLLMEPKTITIRLKQLRMGNIQTFPQELLEPESTGSLQREKGIRSDLDVSEEIWEISMIWRLMQTHQSTTTNGITFLRKFQVRSRPV